MPVISNFPSASGGGELKYQTGQLSFVDAATRIEVTGLPFKPLLFIIAAESTAGSTGLYGVFGTMDYAYIAYDELGMRASFLPGYDALYANEYAITNDGFWVNVSKTRTDSIYDWYAYYVE